MRIFLKYFWLAGKAERGIGFRQQPSSITDFRRYLQAAIASIIFW
ncbi:MAG: hypothetical protein ACLS3T_03845 [Anaerobutyricum sp.]